MFFIKIRTLTLALPRPFKRALVISSDIVLAAVAVLMSFYLYLGNLSSWWDNAEGYGMLEATILAVAVALPIFVVFGLYRAIFRYNQTAAFVVIIKAAAIYGFVYFVFIFLSGVERVPVAIGLIQPIIFFLLIIASRFVANLWLGTVYRKRVFQGENSRVLIYGAGNAGRILLSALEDIQNIKVIGFLDDNPNFQGSMLDGFPIYSIYDVPKLVAKYEITNVILSFSNINFKRRREVFETFDPYSISVALMPSYLDILKGQVDLNQKQEIADDDVLGRTIVEPDKNLMRRDIQGKIVLVTGAGGSIGSEICIKILAQKPKKLILVEHSEYALHSIYQKLEAKRIIENRPSEITAQLGSILDEKFLTSVFTEFCPETVFHTAAYKHVPLVEINPFQGLKNNVLGTYGVAKAAVAGKVKKFVLISTDKAVRPTNIMGASKRLAEMMLQAMSTKQSQTIFAIVRFGNVLNSSGSVIPLFQNQIKSGGPVTLTHRDITRYFMTVSEASELVIQAGAMTGSPPLKDQSAPIYLLEMGQPIKIFDLASSMIKLFGLTVYNPVTGEGDIEIKITGLRPGEKLFEELLIDNKSKVTKHPKINISQEKFLDWRKMKAHLEELEISIENRDEITTRKIIKKLVVGYSFEPKKMKQDLG